MVCARIEDTFSCFPFVHTHVDTHNKAPSEWETTSKCVYGWRWTLSSLRKGRVQQWSQNVFGHFWTSKLHFKCMHFFALDGKSDGTCTWLSYFCNYFKAAGPNVIFRGCMNWSQISYRSHSRVTTDVVVYHINYEQDLRTFDKQKVSRYICCYFEQCIYCFIIWKNCYGKCASGFSQINAT